MQKRILFVILSGLLMAAFLAGCGMGLFATPTPTATVTLVPTHTPQPTVPPTATPEPIYIEATVLSGEIQAPAVLYHRWANDTRDDDSTHVRYSTFKAQLQQLYDAGFSLVSLSSWLDGSFTVPAGRKPLLFTIDDGFFADQLFLNDDGTPSEYSGLGILYQFAQEHPDFGYAASINVNMGDKYYGDRRVGDWFQPSDGDGWKPKLGEAMVWALENNVEIFNHTYTHADLALTDPAGIEFQLQKNDSTERDFLALVGRADLNNRLGNVIALPYGNWPATQAGMEVLKNYINPEGMPVAAIEEAYNASEPVFTPSVFSTGYDRMSLPRITATSASIDWIVAHKDEIPTATSCQLQAATQEQANDSTALQALIAAAIQAGTCPEGVYHLQGFTFVANNGSISLFNH